MLMNGLGIASITVQETTGKGLIDHTASTVTQKDCRLPRAFDNQPVCQPLVSNKAQITTTVVKSLTVSEVEARYK